MYLSPVTLRAGCCVHSSPIEGRYDPADVIILEVVHVRRRRIMLLIPNRTYFKQCDC